MTNGIKCFRPLYTGLVSNSKSFDLDIDQVYKFPSPIYGASFKLNMK